MATNSSDFDLEPVVPVFVCLDEGIQYVHLSTLWGIKFRRDCASTSFSAAR